MHCFSHSPECKNKALAEVDKTNSTALEQLEKPTSKAGVVTSTCYTYTVPTDYELHKNSKHCTSSVNIPRGDALTRVVVKPNTGSIGPLSDVVDKLNAGLVRGDSSTQGVVEQEELAINGKTAYYIAYEDSYGLLFGNYIIPISTDKKDENGTQITAYSIAGYTYNSALKDIVRGVADSLVVL